MSFAVGDVVEVVHVHEERNRSWLGRQLVVSGVNRCGNQHIDFRTQLPYLGEVIDTAPMPECRAEQVCQHWRPESLRKINPPDFAVPVTESHEVEA